MEKLNVKFTLSAKEMFYINIYSAIKTTVLVLILGAVLSLISGMLFELDKVITIFSFANYYKGLLTLGLLVIGAGLAYLLLVIIYTGIKILISVKKDRYILDERIISIDEEKGIILYSDGKKEGVKWGQYKIYLENQKYLVLRDDVYNIFILKKEVFSPQDMDWFKKNLKEQNLIEYRKKLEAKRNR